MKNKNQGEVGKEHRGVPSAETKPTPTLDAAPSQLCAHGTYRSLCPECSELS